MADIFISYAREDRERVRPIQASLESRGFDVFWDTEIQPGHRWDETLQEKLEFAKCVLVAWSESSVTSHWVKDEASYGRDHNILLPITLDGTPPPLGFRQIQTVDLSKWKGDVGDPAIRDILGQAERLLGSEPAARTEATPTPAARKRGAAAVIAAIAVVLALVIVAAAAWVFREPLRTALQGSDVTAPVQRQPVPAVSAATALPKPGERFKECADCPTMVVLPAGQSVVGAPAEAIRSGDAASDQGPQHRIVIGAPFAVSETEVTLGEYRQFVAETGRKPPPGCTIFNDGFAWSPEADFERPGYTQTADYPVVCVSFDDARAYADWLSQKTGARYRLLSEAEWEYAARAGSDTTYSFGEDASDFCRYANIADLAASEVHNGWRVVDCNDGYAGAAPTGSFEANAFGLADMQGNVWEWVADCWHGSFELAPIDGSAWTEDGDCERRVVRGGGWDVGPTDARISLRGKLPANDRHSFYGFRVART